MCPFFLLPSLKQVQTQSQDMVKIYKFDELKNKTIHSVNGIINVTKNAGSNICDASKAVTSSIADITNGMRTDVADLYGETFNSLCDFCKYYSESDLTYKLREFAVKAGYKLVYIVLCLFYSLDKATIKEKALILGALGYFILPIDAIPDTLVGIGFSDDMAELLTVFYTLRNTISEQTKNKSRNKLSDWFNDINNVELPDMDSISQNDISVIKRILNKRK